MHWRRKWQPTPVFLPGESQGPGSLVGCRLWGRTESDTTEVTQQQQQQQLQFSKWPMVAGLQPHNSVLFPLRLEAEAVSCLRNLWVALSPGLLKKFNNSELFLFYCGVPADTSSILRPAGHSGCPDGWIIDNNKMAESSALQFSSA